MLARRLNYPRTTGLILRRTFPDLYKSHIVKLFEEYPDIRRYWREQSKELYFPWNGSRLFFGSAEHAGDINAFHSSEFADIMPDEAQEFSQGELEQLSASNRCTSNKEITPKMIFTFMPGISESGIPPVGLQYLKRVFVDGERKGNEERQKWAFVQAFSWDNIEWARKELEQDGVSEEEFYSWSHEDRRQYFIERTEYGATLNALTNKALRDAWLYGKFDIFEGQYFPQFSSNHILNAEQVEKDIKPWHRRWLSLDWGYDHPFTVHWHAQDEKGQVTTYRELWGRHVNETDLAKQIAERSRGEKLIAFPVSWDAGKLSPRAMKEVPKSIVQMITDALPPSFPRPFPADSSPGTRPSGARLLSQLLDSGMWHISEDCKHLIECLPTLVRNPDNTEDVLKVDYSVNQIGDDPYDCARMGLSYMLGTSRKPVQEIIAEEARKIEDPVARALFVHKRTYEQQDKSRGTKPVSVPSWVTRVR